MSADPVLPSTADNSRAIYVLMVVVFINIAGFGVVIPLLPFYAKSFGAPEWQVFLLFTAYSLGNFFAEPLWGRLSDRIGRRPVLMMTIAGNAATYIALAFAPSIGAAMLIRFTGGILTGNISTIQGYMADVTAPDRRAARLGLLGASFSAGFVTGPVLGGLLARPELGTVGFRPPLFLAAALCLAAFAGVVLFVRESRHAHSDAPERGRLQGLRDAFAHPVIWRAMSVSLITVGGFAAMEACFGLWAEDRFGWGPREIGLCFLSFAATAVLGQALLTARLARRIGETNTLLVGLVLIGLGLVAAPLAPDWPLALVALSTITLGQALTFPNIGAVISRAASPRTQGEMLGLNTASMALARIVGPLMAAPLFTAFGSGAPFLAASVLIVPALAMAWQVRRQVRRLA